MKTAKGVLPRIFSGILIALLLCTLLCTVGCTQTANKPSYNGLSSNAIPLQDKTPVSSDKLSDSETTQTTVSDLTTSEEGMEDPVWIPTKTGTKYHRKPNCSGMKNPEMVSKKTAQQRGFSPCNNCY